jgi:hypothetical protein
MKTIIETATNVSKYIFADDAVISMGADAITCPDFVIGDMHSGNAQVVTNVTPPEDWSGCKYLLIDGTWSVNPNWSEPEDLPE